MILSTHADYLNHLQRSFSRYADNADVFRSLTTYVMELITLCDLSLDPLRDQLAELYCPTGQGDPYDPCCMLRSWLLMTLLKVASPDDWAIRLRCEPLLAILAGFTPAQTPCATAHRDFLTRFADGPYALRVKQDLTLSEQLTGRHTRRLKETTGARRAEADRQHVTQSELLCRQLLEQTDTPRDPNALQTRLDELFVELGLTLSLKDGILGDPQQIIAEGDGTPLETAASPDGAKTCECPPNSKDCDHPREYTSATAQWIYHPRTGWTFGDESYTISVHVNHHDLPLISIMGVGNESDFTLSLKALDDLLNTIHEHELPLRLTIFAGDGHHDASGIYRYLKAKGILPVIPLKGKDKDEPGTVTTTTTPHFDQYPGESFDTDGTPLCPGGCRLRHEHYQARKDAHYYTCPAKRRNGKGEYIFHAEDCPYEKDCCPEKCFGYSRYLPSATNLRYFPEIPRDSHRFKELYRERSGVERSNAVEDSYKLDRRHRNAVYGLIRLTFVNICKHARIRWMERLKLTSRTELLTQTLVRFELPVGLPN